MTAALVMARMLTEGERAESPSPRTFSGPVYTCSLHAFSLVGQLTWKTSVNATRIATDIAYPLLMPLSPVAFFDLLIGWWWIKCSAYLLISLTWSCDRPNSRSDLYLFFVAKSNKSDGYPIRQMHKVNRCKQALTIFHSLPQSQLTR